MLRSQICQLVILSSLSRFFRIIPVGLERSSALRVSKSRKIFLELEDLLFNSIVVLVCSFLLRTREFSSFFFFFFGLVLAGVLFLKNELTNAFLFKFRDTDSSYLHGSFVLGFPLVNESCLVILGSLLRKSVFAESCSVNLLAKTNFFLANLQTHRILYEPRILD